MRKLVILGSLLALLVPAASQAQVSLGVRLGFAPAMGDAFKDSFDGTTYAMSDAIKSQVPLQVELGFPVSPAVSLGGYFSYGIGQVGGDIKDECEYYDLDCSARSVRLGVQALFALGNPGSGLAPWAGAGIGYEWAGFEQKGYGDSFELKTSGPELNLQLGGDYRVNPNFSVGPYVMLSIGRYSNVEVESTFGSGEVPADETLHEWLGFGIRGKFDL
jgi:hypothetical protein